MYNLIIIGAGGFGREVLNYANDIKNNDKDVKWIISGFLDDNLESLNNYNCDLPIIGTISEHIVSESNVYICAIGNPSTKKRICDAFLDKGAKFINLVHPTARVGSNCSMGQGNVICPFACLNTDVTLGNFILINCHSTCGHDAVIEDYCTLSHFCDITGFTRLKSEVFLGSHASICPSVTVGSGTKIGAGAIVINDIPSNCTAVGVPAKVINKK